MSETVKANLVYPVLPADDSKPYINAFVDPTTGERGTNVGNEIFEFDIENLRGREHSVSLDTTGFQYFKKAAKHTSFTDDAQIEKEYYPESIDLLKKYTGASRVVLFDHTIRRRRPGDNGDTPQTRQPALRVRVDQTTKAAIARVKRHLPEWDVPQLLSKRFQIINLWRPINHVALDHPLALCDYRSVETERDLFPVALKYPDREGETFGVLHNPNHKWKYMRGMEPDEGVLIKCFDSIQDGSVAILTPHTAFIDPTTPEDVPLRESIELRALVFYD